MRRGLPALLACAALALLAGCGSSESSSTTGSSAAASTSSPGSGASGTASTSTGTGTTAKTAGAKGSGGLKVDTTPKFATPPSSSPVQSGVVQIAYRNIAIDPDTTRVKVGSTIKWTNYDSVEHNVTSKGGPQKFASKSFGEGGTFEVKVTKPGVIDYECTIHPTTMNGSIEVVK